MTTPGIPMSKASLPIIANVQTKLVECVQEAQQEINQQYEKGITNTLQWDVGEKIWLSSRNISPQDQEIPSKLDHQLLGPCYMCTSSMFPLDSCILCDLKWQL